MRFGILDEPDYPKMSPPLRPLPRSGKLVLPYPDEPAAEVKKWAIKAGKAQIAFFVDQVRDWLGHPEILYARATAWGTEATSQITAAQEAMTMAQTGVGLVWEGAAEKAYQSYLAGVQSVAKETADAMQKFAELLMSVHTLIIEAYNTAITFIGNTASSILAVGSGLIEKAVDPRYWVTGVPSAILKLISQLYKDLTQVATDTHTRFGELTRTGQQLGSTIAKLKAPPNLHALAGDRSSWQPRRVPS